MTTAPTAGVGATAVATAMLRAWESSRPDRLFDDPLAERFMHAAGHSMPLPWPYPDALLGEYFTVRTHFFDEVLLTAAKKGCRQVVLLAAGLDTRFQRLDWPEGVRVFELDLAEVLRFKQSVLDVTGIEQSGRVAVAVDLAKDWEQPLLEAGFEPGAPTAWLAEGLLFYLTMEDCDRLCERARALSGGNSVLAFDHMSPGLFDSPQYRPRVAQSEELQAPWQSMMEDPREHLRHLGWHADVHDSVQVAEGYRRQPPAIEPGPSGRRATMWLVHAELRERHR